MIDLKTVRYCRLGTPDIESAAHFATTILGLEIAHRSTKSIHFKSDERDHTLCYFEGDPADQTTGFEVGGAADIEAAAKELVSLGHEVHRGTTAECERRCVRDFIAFKDPSGNRIEVVLRPAHSGKRYHGMRDAGVTGFSHVGLYSTDVVRDEAFWTKVCNARVSDRIGDAPLLRFDAVHHTIAILPGPKPGIHHINHQVESTDDVQKSYRVLLDQQVPILLGPGRHPASSAQFLYFNGPDNLTFEYSVGVKMINDEPIYRERQLPADLKGVCEWGARPTTPSLDLSAGRRA